jgi:hypothetical protein
LEDYFPIVKKKSSIVKKKGLAYDGFVEYDALIDDFIEEEDYLSMLSEYERIHLVVLVDAVEFDPHLIERDRYDDIIHFDREKFAVWTRCTFDEILMIVKSVKFNRKTFCVDNWCHMMLTFGKGFINIFGNEEYLSRFPEQVETMTHSGTIYDHEDFFPDPPSPYY